jgi:hypothetical protein
MSSIISIEEKADAVENFDDPFIKLARETEKLELEDLYSGKYSISNIISGACGVLSDDLSVDRAIKAILSTLVMKREQTNVDEAIQEVVNSSDPTINEDERLIDVPTEWKSQFGNVVWTRETPQKSWWPSYVCNPFNVPLDIRARAIKHIGKRHIVFYYGSNSYGFVIANNDHMRDYVKERATADLQKISTRFTRGFWKGLPIADSDYCLPFTERTYYHSLVSSLAARAGDNGGDTGADGDGSDEDDSDEGDDSDGGSPRKAMKRTEDSKPGAKKRGRPRKLPLVDSEGELATGAGANDVRRIKHNLLPAIDDEVCQRHFPRTVLRYAAVRWCS